MAQTKQELQRKITADIITAIETGNNGTWTRPWAVSPTGGLPTRASGETYKGINILILLLAGYANRHWMTYRQAKTLGGQVRKGERSTIVTFYKPLKITDRDTGDDKTIPLMRFYSVFNAEQIDDLPDRFHAEAVARPAAERDTAIDAYVATTGADVRHGGDRAFYAPGKDRDFIQMPDAENFTGPVAYYGTLLHELVHWTSGVARCDRKLSFHERGEYAFEELIAEIGASFLAGAHGIEPEIRVDHVQYIASWLNHLKDDDTAIFRAASAAQKAVDHLDGLQNVVAELAAA